MWHSGKIIKLIRILKNKALLKKIMSGFKKAFLFNSWCIFFNVPFIFVFFLFIP